MTTRRDFIRQCAGLAVAGAAAGPVLAQGSVQEGIDVSHWQGAINWASVAASGKKFAICKATDGLSFVDDRFSTNWPQIKANGMVRGAYHYGRVLFDPIKQARHFYKTVRPGSGDLPLCLDLEEPGTGQTPTQIKIWTQRFCSELTRKLGRAPLVYTGFYYWRDQAGNSPNNFGMQLWMARWDTTPFPLPIAWSNWTFWQYSSTGSVPGITGDVDLDQFNGSLSALQGMGMP